MNESQFNQVGVLIRKAQRVMVVSHIRPDGDAVGSLLGLGLALQAAGKQIQMVLQDGVPGNFKHLYGADQVVSKPDGQFDVRIVVDCSDLVRTGNVFAAGEQPEVNIDHHVTNLNFARYNFVEPTAVSTTEVLADCIRGWELPLNAQVAAALLTGLLTDTLGFRTSNMQPKTLRLAATLMETGADLYEISQRSLSSRSYPAIRFWGAGLSRMQLKNHLVWTTLTLDDRHLVSYPGKDDADLVGVLAKVKEAKVALIFVEQGPDKVKVSWRARPGVDVSTLALNFGGGGHPAAAGAEIEGSLETVQSKVLEATWQVIKNGNSRGEVKGKGK